MTTYNIATNAHTYAHIDAAGFNYDFRIYGRR